MYQKYLTMITSEIVGQRMRQVRTEIVKTSQIEFSEQIGMTQANVSMLENGKIYPSCFLLLKLNTLYKINLNWLLVGTGSVQMEQETDKTEVKKV